MCIWNWRVLLRFKFVDGCLKNDFVFSHRQIVISGRRGIKCCVCHEEEQKYDRSLQSAFCDHPSYRKFILWNFDTLFDDLRFCCRSLL